MKIVLVTVGSRGDVQPMLALSLALKERGHEVLLAGPPERARWAAALACPYVPLGRDVMAFIEGGRSTRSPAAGAAFHRFLQGEIRHQFRVLPGLIAGAGLAVGASLCFSLASVAEAMKIPYRFIAFTPQLLPSGYHPCPVFKTQHLPAFLNRVGWWWAVAMDRFSTARLINQHRRELGLKPVTASHNSYLGDKVIVASDLALAGIPPDVTRNAVQTGYMHLRQPVPDLPALEDFLGEGPPPIYAGFGSMPPVDQARIMPLVLEAARMAGRRVVIDKPREASSMPVSGRDVFLIHQYPHEVLFHRMAAVVHHGGAGTTATAAKSGVPQIIVPHILDQYYWGDRVYRAGIGSRAIHHSRLTVRRLAREINLCVNNASMKQKALAVRETILRQDAIRMTIKELVSQGDKR